MSIFTSRRAAPLGGLSRTRTGWLWRWQPDSCDSHFLSALGEFDD